VHTSLFFVTDLAEHYAQIASYMRIMAFVCDLKQAGTEGAHRRLDAPAMDH
jgi:hypothetical protein